MDELEELDQLRNQIDLLSAENAELASACASWQQISDPLVDAASQCEEAVREQSGYTDEVEACACALMTKELPTIVAVYRTAFEVAEAFEQLVTDYDGKHVLLLDTDSLDEACDAVQRHRTVLQAYFKEGVDMVLPPQCVEKHCSFPGCPEPCSDMDWCYGCKSYVCWKHTGETIGLHATQDHWGHKSSAEERVSE